MLILDCCGATKDEWPLFNDIGVVAIGRDEREKASATPEDCAKKAAMAVYVGFIFLNAGSCSVGDVLSIE